MTSSLGPTPAGAADDGRARPALVDALTRHDEAGPGSDGFAVLEVLVTCRLLVPVVAVVDELADDGEAVTVPTGRVRAEKSSHMAAVLTTSASGQVGLLAFTGTASMQRWDPAARPVPVTAADAAQAALADGATALVLDLAGPVTFVVSDADLRALAAGGSPVRGPAGQAAWAVPLDVTGSAAVAERPDGTAEPSGQPRARSRWWSRLTRRGR